MEDSTLNTAQLDESWRTLLLDACRPLGDASKHLLHAVHGIPEPDDSDRMLYLHLQAETIAATAGDVPLLVHHNRLHNILALCRIAFESRVHFVAARTIPNFAAEKLYANTLRSIDQLEQFEKDLGPLPAVGQRFASELQQRKASLEKELGTPPQRQWRKFEVTAKAAGMAEAYSDFYPLLSAGIHNTPSGLVGKVEWHVLVFATIRLLQDSLETLGDLLYFREKPDAPAVPLTSNWKALIAPLQALGSQCITLQSRQSRLTDVAVTPR